MRPMRLPFIDPGTPHNVAIHRRTATGDAWTVHPTMVGTMTTE